MNHEAVPVAWGMRHKSTGLILDVISPDEHAKNEGSYTEPLYAAPPAPQPLTLSSGQIARCMMLVSDPLLWGRMGEQCGVIAEEFARAVLAAAQEKS